MRKSKTDSAAVELRFLVAPALVEAARLAMAPFSLEEDSRKSPDPAATGRKGKGRPFPGLTMGELKILLRD